ncbi:MAG: DedA family protein [Reinekea sp.]|jgi:membrane protein DedA with SNARE-associated domain
MSWLNDSPVLILVAVAIVSFMESFALLGLLVPGVVVLFSLMALAHHYHIGLLPLLIAGAIGGFSGDVSSFLIGTHLQGKVDQWPWLQRHQSWLNQGHWFIKKWGWLSVIIGRFLGPLRPIIPLVAGSLGMRPSLFITLSAITVLAWAPAYLLPGYFTGELSELWQLQPLSTRSLSIYSLTVIAISGSALVIYHHTHPHRWHLRGWLTAHQAERWPISEILLLTTCLLILICMHFWWTPSLDISFRSWSNLWKRSYLVPELLLLSRLSAPAIALGCSTLCLAWLVLANQQKLASLFLTGIILLLALTYSETLIILEPQTASKTGLAILVYTSGFCANLINQRVVFLRKWLVYFIASQWIALLMTSQMWEGTLTLSQTLQAICLALSCNSLLRICWQILYLGKRIPPFGGMMGLIIVGALSAALLSL